MKRSLGYKIQATFIFVIHIVLLYWIYWLLQNTGAMTTEKVMLHFTGIGIYGALLIRGCAAWAKYHHEKNSDGR
jgi:sugar phosphate permease